MSRILTGRFLDGEEVLKRAKPGDVDGPELAALLGFLARDIVSHPERLQSIDARLE